ncbi:MAG: hypothetical protein HQK77_17985 [Desulfobacterales bacterium]|nr:hypothetical protein [Desulfobacterales bacterium]
MGHTHGFAVRIDIDMIEDHNVLFWPEMDVDGKELLGCEFKLMPPYFKSFEKKNLRAFHLKDATFEEKMFRP